jgi:hypothetical protein
MLKITTSPPMACNLIQSLGKFTLSYTSRVMHMKPAQIDSCQGDGHATR